MKIKKLLAVLMSLLMTISLFSVLASTTAFAADTEFEQYMEKQGFPDNYKPYLRNLHQKYPNWKFEAFQTGLTWDEAVSGERSYHDKQLIEKSAKDSFKCKCSKCYKNGNYVIQEGSSWVSASKEAVEYYLNPLNFLNDKYIYQFESTKYSSSHTISGIESILKNTWMYKSYISYKDAEGNTHTLNETYSHAILDAAKDSGLSAYYIASKIVQEVGGKNAVAGGASGTYSSYPGIYNYYNIRANTGAADGLKWASSGLETNRNTTLYKSVSAGSRRWGKVVAKNKVEIKASASASSQTSSVRYDDNYLYIDGESGDWYKVSYTEGGKTFKGYVEKCYVEELPNINASGKITDIPKGTSLTYKSVNGDFYKVSVKIGSNTYTGYIDRGHTNASNGRPWYTPKRSIYYGAQWIYNSFSKYQFTGYLQKFNVNKESGNLYNHEYMANVAAAASEAYSSYKAYSDANIVANEKVFSIPVFKGTPNATEGPQSVEDEITFNAKGIVTANGNLNVRTGPGQKYSIVTSIAKGTEVKISAKTENDWYKISFIKNGKNYNGYASAQYIKVTSVDANYEVIPSERMGQVMISSADLKSSADNLSMTITTAKKGYKLYINDDLENGWYKVSYYLSEYESYAGYIEKKYVNIISGEKKPLYRAIFADDVKVYEKASENSKVSSTRVEDALFYVDNTENEWCHVSYSDGGNWYYGYVQKDFLIPKDTKMPFDYKYSSRLGQVMTDTAFLKSAPNENSTSLKQVLKGYKLYINGEENGYFKVSFYTNDRYYAGYFPKQYANILEGEKKPLYRAIFASDVKVYEKASENSKVSSTRVEDALFYVDNTENEWCHVSYSDGGNWYYGYVQKDFLIPKDTKMPFDYKYSSRLGQVMTDTAFLKSAPNENSTSLKQVLKGYKLYINGEENGYFKVSFYTNDRYYAGYFPKQYANILQGERKTLYKATVDKINLREKPNNNSTIVSSRNKGNLLYVDYEIGDWYAVSYSEDNRWYYGFVLKSEVAKY